MPVRLPPVRRLAAMLALAAPLSLGACQKEGASATPGDGSKVTGEPVVVQGDVAVASPAALLPGNTVLMIAARSPNRVAEAFERDRLLEELGPLAKGATTFIARELGFDPFDPAAYADLGIDPDGQFGFAVIDGANGVYAVFGRVKDAGKLKQAARDAAGRQKIELSEQTFGTATLLRDLEDGRGEGLVIRDDFAAFVMVDGEAPIDYADRMAKQPTADSLARARGYRKAMGAYDTGDLLIWADVAQVVEAAVAAQGDRKRADSWADEQVAAAKEAGADAEEIARLEKQAETMHADEASWRARDEASAELSSLLAQGVDGTAWRLSAKHSGVFLEGRVALGEDAFLRGALRNTEGRSLFATSLSGEPVFLFEAATDPAASQQVLELMLAANGSSWLQLSKKLAEEAEVSLDDEVWPQLVGDGGIAMTIDEPLDVGDPDKALQKIGLAVRFRVKDPAAARALVERLDASPGELGSMISKDGDRWVVALPDWRKAYLELAGDHLLLATDGQLGIRLSHGTRGMMARQTTPPEAWAAMMMPNRASVFAADIRAMAWMFTSREVAMSVPSAAFAEDVPMSRKAKAKQKQIDEVDAKIAKARAKRDRAEFQQIDAVVSPFGISVVTAAMDERGIDIIGGQLTRDATVGQLLETVLKMSTGTMAAAPDDPKVREELSKLFEQREKLQTELNEIRQKDAERLAGKKRGGSKRGEPKPPKAPKANKK